ncbi:NUAK family SNF1-like kinase 1-like [Planoprotostelium fungivorum]|uniref:NUAK family SNF1-like kinase 1-like n=1 Tax=Planoprotostelium fungivorum TaxID=1890364 RepID=A0A2P6NIK7_9EUKA|nr:NUAK family SNF1-like kinase 1-like [Planoprotostelium fungivorum]
MQPLNRGAYGQLYAAKDKETGKRVVVKVIKKLEEGDRGLIAREIKANATMKGTKGICTLHGYYDEGRQTSLIFDLIHGADLFTILQRRDFQPLPENLVWKIISQVAAALFACHQKGIAHRDVKLENIMVEGDRVYLIDFGLCTFFKVTAGKESLSSKYCGSPEYISPEHLEQIPLRATQVDAWALGITAYALLFGVFPGMRDRLAQLLTIDPTKRSSVKIMMDSPHGDLGDDCELLERVTLFSAVHRYTRSLMIEDVWVVVLPTPRPLGCRIRADRGNIAPRSLQRTVRVSTV